MGFCGWLNIILLLALAITNREYVRRGIQWVIVKIRDRGAS